MRDAVNSICEGMLVFDVPRFKERREVLLVAVMLIFKDTEKKKVIGFVFWRTNEPGRFSEKKLSGKGARK